MSRRPAPDGPVSAAPGSPAPGSPAPGSPAPASYMGVPPVREPSWKPGMIPGYFWLGGVAAGAWTVVALEDLLGEGDARVRRIGRYAAAAALGGGTVLLIADLGRPERFLNMLRVYRPRSAMNVGAWGLAAFGGPVGAAALVQGVRDLRASRARRRGSAGAPDDGATAATALDRAIHVAGLAPALFVGSYTGTLLSSTSAPAWAARGTWLGPLFAAAAASSGIGVVLIVHDLSGPDTARRGARRLARAQAVALSAELLLGYASERLSPRLPSQAQPPADERALRAGAGASVAIGLLCALRGARPPRGGLPSIETDRAYRRYYGSGTTPAEPSDRTGRRARIGAAVLALAGGLALRFLTTRSGRRSARTAEDTWEHAR